MQLQCAGIIDGVSSAQAYCTDSNNKVNKVSYSGSCQTLHPPSSGGSFGAEIQTVQQFVWQLDIVSVANFVMDSFDYLVATGTSNQP